MKRKPQKNSNKKNQQPKINNLYKGFQIPVNNWKPERIDSNIDPEKFFSSYVIPRKPVVFKNLLNDDQFSKIFSMNNAQLIEKAGKSVVEIEQRSSEKEGFGTGKKKVQMSFEEFLNLKETRYQYYMTTQPIEYDEKGPMDLCAAPLLQLIDNFQEVKPKILGNLIPNQYNVWMGFTSSDKGSSSGLHHDYHDNIYILLKGRKKFHIYSPGDAPKLPTYGGIKKVHKNGLICYDEEIQSDGHYSEDEYPGFKNSKQKEMKSIQNQIAILEDMLENLKSEEEPDEQRIEEIEERLEDLMNRQLDYLEDNQDDYEEVEQKNPDNFVKIKDHQVKDCKIGVVELKEGEMFYLPASYYHHVFSYGETHMAINIWMHPPNQNKFSQPYKSKHWQNRYEEMLANTIYQKSQKK